MLILLDIWQWSFVHLYNSRVSYSYTTSESGPIVCIGIVKKEMYRKISNIRRTKSPNLTASRLVLQLSLPNPMKPGVKSRMKM